MTVAVGDGFVGTDAENYVIHVEGTTAIAGYVPTGAAGSATRHATAMVTVNVTDGKLTVDALTGTNTKLDYVEHFSDQRRHNSSRGATERRVLSR